MSADQETALKYCPHCGSKANCCEDFDEDQWFVICSGCLAQMGNPGSLSGFSYEIDAINAWNKRTTNN